MSTTSAKRFSNMNAMQAVNEIDNVIVDAHKTAAANRETFEDKAVVTELMTMMMLSKKCNHRSSTNRGSISYERVPANVSAVATQFELMSMGMTTSTIKNTPTRYNKVTSAIIQTIQTMVDFSTRIDNAVLNVIMITDVHSTIYASLIAFVFRNMCISKSWNGAAKMIMMVHADMAESVDIYVAATEYVEIIKYTDKATDTYKTMTSISDANVTVHTHTTEIAKMYTSANAHKKVNLCWITDLTTYDSVSMISNVITSSNSVMEAVPCSDPLMNTVRIATVTMSANTIDNKTAIVYGIPNPFSCLRWFNNMIRHMDIDGMCFDCKIAYAVAMPIVVSIQYGDESEMTSAGNDELANFSTVVGTAGIVNLVDR